MINLLPTEIKQQTVYARRNRQLLRYAWLATASLVVVLALMIVTQIHLNQQLKAAKQTTAANQSTIAGAKNLEDQAKAINSRLSTIKNIQKSQVHFSVLLSDLAKITPKGASINTVTFNGNDDKKPVTISASAANYQQAVSLRDALASSPRIAAADINSVTAAGSAVTIEITIGFKPGQAK